MEKQKLFSFLAFTAEAEEAMNFYAQRLPGALVTRLERYKSDTPYAQPEDEGLIFSGALSFKGQELMFLDMGRSSEAPSFTWAQSLYVDCDDEGDFDAIFKALSEGGTVIMGPMAIGRARKCAWVTDKFGVTWQPVWV